MCCPFLGFLSLATHDAGARRFDQVESASRAAGFSLTKSSPDEWQLDDEGAIPSCDACGTPSVDAHMPEAEGGPYDRSEELSPSESGAFDDEPESADVPQANDDALEKPGTMAQDLARSPGTGGADADTSDQHPGDQHFG